MSHVKLKSVQEKLLQMLLSTKIFFNLELMQWEMIIEKMAQSKIFS